MGYRPYPATHRDTLDLCRWPRRTVRASSLGGQVFIRDRLQRVGRPRDSVDGLEDDGLTVDVGVVSNDRLIIMIN